MEENTLRTAQFTNILKRLHHTDLVVDVDDTNAKSVWPHSSREDFKINKSVCLYWKIRNGEALVL